MDTLMQSIREKVLTLPDETRLLPGHGPESTVGYERGHNPFFGVENYEKRKIKTSLIIILIGQGSKTRSAAFRPLEGIVISEFAYRKVCNGGNY